MSQLAVLMNGVEAGRLDYERGRLTLTYAYRGHHYVDRREIHLYRTPGARIWGYELVGG